MPIVQASSTVGQNDCRFPERGPSSNEMRIQLFAHFLSDRDSIVTQLRGSSICQGPVRHGHTYVVKLYVSCFKSMECQTHAIAYIYQLLRYKFLYKSQPRYILDWISRCLRDFYSSLNRSIFETSSIYKQIIFKIETILIYVRRKITESWMVFTVASTLLLYIVRPDCAQRPRTQDMLTRYGTLLRPECQTRNAMQLLVHLLSDDSWKRMGMSCPCTVNTTCMMLAFIEPLYIVRDI